MTVLKRYTNRRLYDTRLSRYITLEELAERIRRGEDFKVLDAQSDEDLTRKILMQILVLESLDIAELLPIEFLQTLIRVRDRGVQELFSRYIKVMLEAFLIAQRQLEDNVRLVQQQVSLTAQVMRQLLSLGGVRGQGADEGQAAHGAADAAPGQESGPLASPPEVPADDGSLPVEDDLLFPEKVARGGRGRGGIRRRR